MHTLEDIIKMRDSLDRLIQENVLDFIRPKVDETRKLVILNIEIKKLLLNHYHKPPKLFLRTCIAKDLYPYFYVRMWYKFLSVFIECPDPAEHIMMTVSVETGNPPVHIAIKYFLAPDKKWVRK